ncbi:Gfo/Idh/MocA family protein [Prochlorothrix hollandica]|uniref:Oxidoreductase n=1 Tax=Prochlorothrix hollandica PCC 9006 = CALU 1027 TaxID=317619 RepID=A0A0M2PPJ3_PROHO|nr:Gfo/Idh/MocA family oxidoreductase [Prochlorothrix hollandica]KKI98184.1 oxidoreductase [Prochlorothrix hollandica PCC 9006 = CALU 1027]
MSFAFPPARPLGVAVVGTGFGQKVHIPGLQTYPHTQVVAVYHRDPAQAQAIATAHQIPQACSSVEAIVALPQVEAVSLSTPPFLHFEMAKTILNAGKHLLLEKPTCLTADEARVLHDLAQAQGVVAVMDFEYRFVPQWQHLAQLLHQGYVGQPYLICVDWLMSSRLDPQRPWNWYAQRDQGGGALGALASHSFDYLSWLFGPVQRLQAHLSTAIPQRPDPTTGSLKPVTADDTCLLNLELGHDRSQGVPCQMAISSVSRQGRGHWLEVYGDRGTLILGSSNQKDYVHGFQLQGALGGDDLATLPTPPQFAFETTYGDGRLAPFMRVVDHWLRSIAQGRAESPNLRDGVYSQLLMDISQRSHQTGSWVTVPSLEEFLRV